MQTGTSFSRAGLIVMLALLLLLYGSCVNPYKYLPNKPPMTSKDTAALLARCIAISPLDTTSSHYSPVEPARPDSAAYFKAILDSLGKGEVSVKDSILIKYKDTCTSAIAIYQDGFTIGNEMGKYEGRREAEAMYRRSYHTTDSLHRLEIAKLKHDYNLRLISAANAQGIAQAQAEKYRGKNERLVKWTWGLSIASLLLLIICILLWKFRRQAKAANTIINSGQDIGANLKKLK